MHVMVEALKVRKKVSGCHVKQTITSIVMLVVLQVRLRLYAHFLFCMPDLRAKIFVRSRLTRFSYIKTAWLQRGVMGVRRGLRPTRRYSCFGHIDSSWQGKELPVPL